ncbi:nucleotide exchange factor GrpE [Kitasatospora sp. NPDC094028]
MTTPSRPSKNAEDQRPQVVIHDKRRIDPDTLQLRDAGTKPPTDPRGREHPGGTDSALLAGGAAPRGQAPEETGGEALRAALAERTQDLQRVKAEYDNYRRRVQRERLAIGEAAVAEAVRTLLPVLDTIDQARAHDDAAAGFEAVANRLQIQLASLGLETLGTEGEPFDPECHEALTSTESDHVDHPTCTHILRSGYRLGEILLRPAQVAVEQPPAPDRQSTSTSVSDRTDSA